MSTGEASELTNDLGKASRVVVAAIAAVADLVPGKSTVTISKVVVDGAVKGRRLLDVAGTSEVQFVYQIEGAKPNNKLDGGKVASAIASASQLNGVEVQVLKVVSYLGPAHGGDEGSSSDVAPDEWSQDSQSLPAPHRDEDSSLANILPAVCLAILCIIACLTYWCFVKFKFYRSALSESSAEGPSPAEQGLQGARNLEDVELEVTL